MSHPLRSYIDRVLQSFDRDVMMPQRPSASPGYHTRIPDGTLVHETRLAIDFAVALLIAGDGEEHWHLAGQVIERVVRLQDADEASPTFGIWPWYLEEPLAQMDRPDPNWADFIGARLAHIVVEHALKLDPHALDQARAALSRATRAIVRRDMTADYTNIAIMGAGVAAAAGEALAMQEWRDYARRKLAAVEASVDQHGSFAEYNSPTYALIVLEECDRILQLVRDDATRASAARLVEFAWRCIADHWHPSTQQWAGPHARAYSDRLKPSQLRRISRATGLHFREQDNVSVDRPLEAPPLVEPRPCPADLVDRFRHLPSPMLELRQRCQRGDADRPDRIATTWLSDDACLGTFNRGHFWAQSRPLLAYLKIPDEAVGIFRSRFLMNGRDFAAAHAVQDQHGPRVLSAAHFWTGTRAFHPFFPRPEDAAFDIEDLRLRLQLIAPAARIERINGSRWRMRAADHFIHVHALAGSFDGRPIEWTPTEVLDGIALDAIFLSAPSRRFSISSVPLAIAFAIELSRDPQTSAPPPVLSSTDSTVAAEWQADGTTFQTRVPFRAVPIRW